MPLLVRLTRTIIHTPVDGYADLKKLSAKSLKEIIILITIPIKLLYQPELNNLLLM